VLRIAAVVLLLLWVLGLVTGRTMGGFVHVLLVLALILGLIALVRGKNSPS
jgi:cytochrome c oxidase assembly factor CtaG